MSENRDDQGFDSIERDGAETDPDTNLILDYLANKLDPRDAGKLEERARRDKDFRYKLADLVLLKGLVMLALEKNPAPAARECRRTQRMFLDYIKGTATPEKTAELSRHLEHCFECELAFERFQERPAGSADDEEPARGWRRWFQPTKSLAVTAVVAVVLAAGAVGMVGFLASASAAPHGNAPAAKADDRAGLLQNPDDIRRFVDRLIAERPDLKAGKLDDMVASAIDEPNPMEREKVYRAIGKELGADATAVLHVLAKNEPIDASRGVAYFAMGPAITADVPALLGALRREIGNRSEQTAFLVHKATTSGSPEALAMLRSLYEDRRSDDLWWVRVRYGIYTTVKDAALDAVLELDLADPNPTARSFGALAAATLQKQAGLPVALGLLDSTDGTVQENAAVAIARLGSADDVNTLFARPWVRAPKVFDQISLILTRRGMSPPQNP